MACQSLSEYHAWKQEEARKVYEESRRVTVGVRGKNATFTQRGSDPEEGYVRIDGVTVSGYVPAFGRGGKVFYPWSFGKNAKLAA
jgi:hypothetical protein